MAGMQSLFRKVCWALAMTSLWAYDQAGAQSVGMSENFARQMARVEFRVASGRIVVRSSTFGGRLSSSTNVDGAQERLTIDFAGGLPTIEYERSAADEQLSIRVSPTLPAAGDGVDPDAADFFPPVLGADRIHLRRLPKSEGAPGMAVEFRQEPYFDLSLTVGQGEEQRTIRAATLWYLLLAEPDLCREYLTPLLELLRRDWRLLETAHEIERSMVQAVERRQLPDWQRWAELVVDLGSDDFGHRQAADRALRQSGRAVVPYLESLPPATLDAEQRFRIRRIITATGLGESEDTAARIGLLAAGDPRAWLALLSNAEPARRTLAYRQLCELLDEPLDFDPTGDEARRDLQLRALRQRFEVSRVTNPERLGPTPRDR